jgi:hypothetical protein
MVRCQLLASISSSDLAMLARQGVCPVGAHMLHCLIAAVRVAFRRLAEGVDLGRSADHMPSTPPRQQPSIDCSLLCIRRYSVLGTVSVDREAALQLLLPCDLCLVSVLLVPAPATHPIRSALSVATAACPLIFTMFWLVPALYACRPPARCLVWSFISGAGAAGGGSWLPGPCRGRAPPQANRQQGHLAVAVGCISCTC